MNQVNEATAEKLRKNPFYKPAAGQLPADPKQEEDNVRTFGVPPAVHTIIPKHPTEPDTVIHGRKKRKSIK